jgi:hypothetical protein
MKKDSRGVEARILDYLYSLIPEESTPKDIAFVLKLRHHTVTKALSRMLAKENCPIMSDHRGFYSYGKTPDAIRKVLSGKRVELHGIVLNGLCRNENTAHSFATTASKTYRKRGYYKETFNGRIISITVHEMGLIELQCSTSDRPMGYMEFRDFTIWTKAKFDGIVWENDWILMQLGLNIDTHDLRLDGVSSIKLKVFEKAWFQMYQKDKDLRTEVHLTPKLPLDRAMRLMEHLVNMNPGQQVEEFKSSLPEKADYWYG